VVLTAHARAQDLIASAENNQIGILHQPTQVNLNSDMEPAKMTIQIAFDSNAPQSGLAFTIQKTIDLDAILH
jgi:hypothetical protein